MQKQELRILVVDDNREFSENVKDLLELAGYPATTAYGGRQALEMMRADAPRLVLLDLVMPGMDGLETLRRLREIDPNLPVVILTAFGEEDILDAALAEGAQTYFNKPVDFGELLRLLDGMVAAGSPA